jgi:hypothetical protein
MKIIHRICAALLPITSMSFGLHAQSPTLPNAPRAQSILVASAQSPTAIYSVIHGGR